MPLKKCLPVFLFLLISFIISPEAFAQSLIIDSLSKELKFATGKEKPIIMAELARANFEKDIKKSLRICHDAITIAQKHHDKDAEAFCYASMAHLLVQQNQEQRAEKYLDSAVKKVDRHTAPAIASFVWFRKGWLEVVQGNNDKAMSALLKADELIKDTDNRRAINYKVLINHYMASIYAYGSDTLKQHKYAIACLAAARRSIFADDMQTGYMTVAHSFFSAFEKDMSKHSLLDSSLAYHRRALNFYLSNKERILLQSNASVTALNMANSYFKYYPPSFRDSSFKYVNLALKIARTTNGREVIANGYGILSEYALRDKDFKRAEEYLSLGIAELATLSNGVDITRSRMMLGLANIAESSGDLKKALTYYKQYNAYHDKVFDVQKLAVTQQLEEQYHASQRENEIARLKERNDYNRRLNWLYVLIGSTGIISLGFLLSSYHYKLKASQQEQKMANQEREEAELLAKLQQADATRLMLEKQEAELKAALKEEESARLQAQQELLQDRTDWLEKALLAGTLKIEEKNTILEMLKQKASQADSPVIARQIGRIVNQNLRMDKNSEELKSIADIHPGFFRALQSSAGNTLTRLDLKYCSYIAMGLENKDIAIRLGVEPKSIRMTRYRLKQKLNLSKTDNLDQFIKTSGEN